MENTWYTCLPILKRPMYRCVYSLLLNGKTHFKSWNGGLDLNKISSGLERNSSSDDQIFHFLKTPNVCPINSIHCENLKNWHWPWQSWSTNCVITNEQMQSQVHYVPWMCSQNKTMSSRQCQVKIKILGENGFFSCNDAQKDQKHL